MRLSNHAQQKDFCRQRNGVWLQTFLELTPHNQFRLDRDGTGAEAEPPPPIFRSKGTTQIWICSWIQIRSGSPTQSAHVGQRWDWRWSWSGPPSPFKFRSKGTTQIWIRSRIRSGHPISWGETEMGLKLVWMLLTRFSNMQNPNLDPPGQLWNLIDFRLPPNHNIFHSSMRLPSMDNFRLWLDFGPHPMDNFGIWLHFVTPPPYILQSIVLCPPLCTTLRFG